MPRPEHPLVVALVEAYARRIGIEPVELWNALDGKPARAELVRGLVEAFYPQVREADFGKPLPSRRENSTIRTMQTDIEPRRGRPLTVEHPLVTALLERGVTLAEEARAVKRTPTALRNYMYPAKHPSRRPVPRALAKLWHDKYGVPFSAWQSIQD